MTVGGFFLLLLIAALAGAAGQAIGGFSRGGCVLSVVLGFVGAWVGTWIAGQFDLPPVLVLDIQGESFPVFWAVIGAAVVSAVLRLFLMRPRA